MRWTGFSALLAPSLVPFVAYSQEAQVQAFEHRKSGTSNISSPLGRVFDPRDTIEIKVSNVAGGNDSSASTGAAIQALNALVNAATKISQQANKLSTDVGSAPFDARTLGQFVLETVNKLPADAQHAIYGEPETQADLQLNPIVRLYVRASRGLSSYANKQLAVLSNNQIAVKLNVTQYRAARSSRRFTSSLGDFLTVSTDELNEAKSVDPSALKQSVNAWAATEVKKIQSQYDTFVAPKVNDLQTAVGDVGRPVVTSIEATVKDIEQINTSDLPGSVAKVAADTQAAITATEALLKGTSAITDAARNAATALETAITALGDMVRLDLEGILQLGQLAQVAQSSIDLVLAASEAKSVLVGPATGSPTPETDDVFDFENTDTLRIVITAGSAVDKGPVSTPVYDYTSYAYRQGLNLLHTVTLDAFEQQGSARVKFAPAINFLAKYYGRNLTLNSIGSVSFGLAWFPLGVDQQDTGVNQQAVGATLSLLDDWVNVGVARNFGSNRYFMFVGASIPVKF